MSEVPIALALGSNLGDREGHLEAGLASLRARGVETIAKSAIYETEPVGGPPQGPYLNQVALVRTDLDADALLRAALAVEAERGRVRGVRDAPRTLDIDILFHGDLVRRTPSLVLPHPRLHERRFVLVPLAEVAPGWWRHPILGYSATELLARVADRSRVERWRGPVPAR
jgi:2-amino-4-hydroxy-6-hydroxymethyldihydropteridine diphosphokinase